MTDRIISLETWQAIADMPASPVSTVNAVNAEARVERAIRDIAAGRMVVVADDDDRENEGDLIGAASALSERDVAFMVRHTTGILCVGIPQERAEALALPPMVAHNEDPNATAYTVSCDALATGTGVSAADRLLTFRTLADPAAEAGDLRRPGHVFPLCARPNGVLDRPGHTEAAVDLARLAGLYPAGVLGELVNDDGSMMRGQRLIDFASRHNLAFLTVADLIGWRRARADDTEPLGLTA